MQLGMIGLGRMGANMVRRLQRAGHDCVAYDSSPDAIATVASEGATGTGSIREFVDSLETPRAIWLMVPAAAVDQTLADLTPLLTSGDVVVDGGNSWYVDGLRRARELDAKGVYFLDVGVSGGVWGLDNGFCLMIGGDAGAASRLDPIFDALAPGAEAAERTPGRDDEPTAAERGYLYCGSSGAGHFVKMVHNGIEYGLMAAYAEGFNVLRHANAGAADRPADAETTPLHDPEHYRYELDLDQIAEVWRRGSVVRSWLLDLTAAALYEDPLLDGFEGSVSDSGEGRWTSIAAIDSSTPTPVLTAALFERFASRGEADFAGKVLSAMRSRFGGHVERPGSPDPRPPRG
jgi:6-phosphogluconate dehydrogenase